MTLIKSMTTYNLRLLNKSLAHFLIQIGLANLLNYSGILRPITTTKDSTTPNQNLKKNKKQNLTNNEICFIRLQIKETKNKHEFWFPVRKIKTSYSKCEANEIYGWVLLDFKRIFKNIKSKRHVFESLQKAQFVYEQFYILKTKNELFRCQIEPFKEPNLTKKCIPYSRQETAEKSNYISNENFKELTRANNTILMSTESKRENTEFTDNKLKIEKGKKYNECKDDAWKWGNAEQGFLNQVMSCSSGESEPLKDNLKEANFICKRNEDDLNAKQFKKVQKIDLNEEFFSYPFPFQKSLFEKNKKNTDYQSLKMVQNYISGIISKIKLKNLIFHYLKTEVVLEIVLIIGIYLKGAILLSSFLFTLIIIKFILLLYAKYKVWEGHHELKKPFKISKVGVIRTTTDLKFLNEHLSLLKKHKYLKKCLKYFIAKAKENENKMIISKVNELKEFKLYFFKQKINAEELLPTDIVLTRINDHILTDSLLLNGCMYYKTILDDRHLKFPLDLNETLKKRKNVIFDKRDFKKEYLSKQTKVSYIFEQEFGDKKEASEKIFSESFNTSKEIHYLSLKGKCFNNLEILKLKKKLLNKRSITLEKVQKYFKVICVALYIVLSFVLGYLLKSKFRNSTNLRIENALTLFVICVFIIEMYSSKILAKLINKLVTYKLSKKNIILKNKHLLKKVEINNLQTKMF